MPFVGPGFHAWSGKREASLTDTISATQRSGLTSQLLSVSAASPEYWFGELHDEGVEPVAGPNDEERGNIRGAVGLSI
jgi:hypothetical protein